ncbi:lipase family protein [Emydomyces testavorans]|uniref:Lipase family protein n=1 Tax=Emydomyces testavorans TaxID=2070801 RepID=A0AAF0IJW6_9EURO|nr:lipase family protein [Emydomyces testavorans]
MIPLPWTTFRHVVLAILLFLPALAQPHVDNPKPVSRKLFNSLEELARIVDITYCVGTTGIYKPFRCAGRCREFKGFELVKTWHTGPLLSDSCGYLALSHPPWPKRIILAFRGTYSITNTIVDLSAIPQVYVPYPEPSTSPDPHHHRRNGDGKCDNCTVHAGFMASWLHARTAILDPLSAAIARYPDYRLVVVGHSLGGAVAALAALEFRLRGWTPQVTTFGEPRIGNRELAAYLDGQFTLPSDQGGRPAKDEEEEERWFRRVTHINDPVPLLPLSEWGYAPHAGEIFISKPDLPPGLGDLRVCDGDADLRCSAGSEAQSQQQQQQQQQQLALKAEELQRVSDTSEDVLRLQDPGQEEEYQGQSSTMSLPARYKLWELFFAHRDYFWRVGVCLPKPEDWFPGWDGRKRERKWWWPRLWPWRGKAKGYGCMDD